MTYVFFLLLAGLVLPMLAAARSRSVWQSLLMFATISTKAAVFGLFYATVVKEDAMVVFTATVAIGVGNAGLLGLAYGFGRLGLE